jgi:hypothetical protein
MTSFRQIEANRRNALKSAMAGDLPARAARSIPARVDGAAGRQDDHSGVGDRAFHGVSAKLVVGDCVSRTAPERGSLRPFHGVDLAEIANLAATTLFGNRNGIAQL